MKNRGITKAGQILLVVAQGILTSKHIGLGSFGRRIRAKRGPKVAIKAIAAKIAKYYYLTMTKGIDFVMEGLIDYEKREKEKRMKYMQKWASENNLQLVSM